MYGWYYDPTFILVFAGLILTLIASAGVKSTFSRYSRVRCMAGYTGAQADRKCSASAVSMMSALSVWQES